MLAFVTLLFAALVGRLAYLQIGAAPFYRKQARAMRSQTIANPARRGSILDRDGKPLAVCTSRSDLVCDALLVKDSNAEANEVSAITGIPASTILAAIGPGRLAKPGSRNALVCGNLAPAAVLALRARLNRPGGDKRLIGMSIRETPQRMYPLGRDAAHTVGFVTATDGKLTGKMGIEQALDRVLAGSDGSIEAELDPRRRVIPDTQRRLIAAHDGPDVRLTLDQSAQHVADTELERCCSVYRPVGATAIVMDPQTGDILALASWPGFNPATRKELASDPAAYSNYALRLYEPGSTMKPLAVAGALRLGLISPTTTFYCGGELKIGNRTIRCAVHGASAQHGHGAVTARDILAQSCNVGAARIGLLLGYEKLRPWLAELGLYSPTGIGLPGDHRGRDGFGADEGRNGRGKVARIAFGQSVTVTPLAMTAAYAAIANGGTLMQPRLIAAYQDSKGTPLRTFGARAVRRVLSPELAAQLREMLRAVVTDGTGKGTRIPGYTSAGKTGTAQKVREHQRGYAQGAYVASFIGFVPAEKPRAVIAVVVDEPHGAYYGAEVAGPVFQRIASQLMYTWNVPPDDPASLTVAPKSAVATPPARPRGLAD